MGVDTVAIILGGGALLLGVLSAIRSLIQDAHRLPRVTAWLDRVFGPSQDDTP